MKPKNKNETKKVLRMAPGMEKDFYAIHCKRNNAHFCYCAAWWVETWEGWEKRTPAQNKKLRNDLFKRGEYDGYILFVNQKPVGWCQVGPRDRLVKLLRQKNLRKDPAVWAITCFQIAPSQRGKGRAKYLLAQILNDLKKRGVKKVQAFPMRGNDLNVYDLWTGPEEMYKKAGFRVVKNHSVYPVLSKSL